MKRERKITDDIFVYAGTAVFILLAIALGLIMYMTAKTGKEIGQIEQLNSKEQDKTEIVTNDIGKTVEEQEKNNKENNENVEEKTNEITNNLIPSEEKETEQVQPTNVENQPEEKVTETKKEMSFIKPCEGEIICEYAKDNLIYSETLKEWITHTAIDIKADKTSVVKSAADGIVKTIVNDPRYGLTVVVEHDEGYETVYSNLLTAEFVVEGEELTQGQTIGTVGNTAAFESNMDYHLHLELMKDGEYLDPTIYLK